MKRAPLGHLRGRARRGRLQSQVATLAGLLFLATSCVVPYLEGDGSSDADASGGSTGSGGDSQGDFGGQNPGSGGVVGDGDGGGPMGDGGGAAGGAGGGTGGGSTGGTDGSGGGGSGGGGSGGEGSGGGDSGGGGGTASTKFVGNITTLNAVDTDGLIFSDHWDQLTPEAAGKWGSVQSTASSARNWGPLDAVYDYAEDKGIIFKQSAFVAGSQQPSGTITEVEVRAWMTSFCDRYPNTRLIDVVYEPPPHSTPLYANSIGGGTSTTWQWIINAFTWARDACPNAILILNDYNNIEFSSETDHFIGIVNTVLTAGAPLDAIGAEGHGLAAIPEATMINLSTRLHDETGLPIYITEYDIDEEDDQAQLAAYESHMTFFLETEWIDGVTVYGWIQGKTWRPDTGLVTTGGQPRAAMTWLMTELGRPVP